jgi:hypothetical protein
MMAAARLVVALLAAAAMGSPAAARSVETIVLVRHGEKPSGGFGRLDCQGLNRAQALPGVILGAFGKPDALFAPDPGHLKKDDGVKYPYRRPLQTLEPLSRQLGLPIQTSYGYKQTGRLAQALDAPDYRGATVVVAWEHKRLVDLARRLMTEHGGDADAVPRWHGSDFDGIYVVRIAHDGETASASFEQRRQGLDGQSRNCPP